MSKDKTDDWFDKHVIVAGNVSDDFAKKLVSKLKEETRKRVRIPQVPALPGMTPLGIKPLAKDVSKD